MRHLIAAVLAMAVCVLTSPSALAQAFTYQGRLESAGAPATGSYDFQFALFTAPTGGTQVGLTTQHNAVPVEDGLFTVALSFANAFTGPARSLEIRVRPAGVGGFTTLTPRQNVTPAPYAIKALTENFVKLLDGVTLINDPGTTRVLLNRTTPVLSTEVLSVTALTGSGSGGIVVNHADTSGSPFLTFTTAGVFRGSLSYDHASTSVRLSAGAGPTPALTATPIGVGLNLATTPTQALEVGGAAAADTFMYRAPATRTLTIPPEAFKPDLTSQTGQFGSSLAFLDTGQTGNISAPVYLPDGAVLTGVTIVYLDNSAANDLTVLLLFRTLTSTFYNQQAGFVSSGSNVNPRTSTAAASDTINTTRAYTLRVSCAPAWSGASTAIKGVQITYTVSQPD
jgi:hypothetical protein